MSRKPKKIEEEDTPLDPILEEGEAEDDDVGESEDTAEIDFDRRRARDWEDLDDLMDDMD